MLVVVVITSLHFISVSRFPALGFLFYIFGPIARILFLAVDLFRVNMVRLLHVSTVGLTASCMHSLHA